MGPLIHPQSPPALFVEKKLAQKIGVSREQLAELRKHLALSKKETWTAGRETVLTEAGLARVLEVLRATSNAPIAVADFSDCLLNPPTEKNGGAPATDAPTPAIAAEQLRVVKRYPNPIWLRASRDDGQEVDVRVPHNRHFVPRMELRATPIAGDRLGRYQLEGRCPQSKGR